jgi:choline dehydrogenase-like flavoprotein
MHIDLEQVSSPRSLHSTICIIGAGIAGLILARRLASRGFEVHLLEAGGLDFEERSQALFQTEMAHDRHQGTTEGRFRTFGGSSTRWGGQLLPFTSDIFDPPAGVPSLPWAISEQEVAPYYDEIHNVLGVDSLPYGAGVLAALGRGQTPESADILIRFSKWIPFRRRNLGRTIGPEVLAHPKVTVFTHANVASLTADPEDPTRIRSARVLNYSGHEFTFTAARFIVAAGTIESSRILLCSPDVPNENDQIGRYFHDHISYHVAEFESPERERVLDLLGPGFVDGTIHSCKLEASPELRAREGLYAVMAHIVLIEPEDSGVAATRNFLRSLQRGQLKNALLFHFIPVFRGAVDVFRLYYYSRFKQRRAVSKRALIRLNIDTEQAPDPQNRIRLSTSTDAIGMPVAIVDWHINQPEKETAARFAHVIHGWLSDAGLCPRKWDSSFTDGTLPQMVDTYHAMGGLRMGDDPATSVVDRNLTVHGLTNLHVASCAVFPSGSSSNPTFTMMALAMRLADHLTAEFTSSVPSPKQQHYEESQALRR